MHTSVAEEVTRGMLSLTEDSAFKQFLIIDEEGKSFQAAV
jgi:hypothetical protein